MRIDGVVIAEKIYTNLKLRVGDLKKKNVIPHLAVILVGENPASVAYVTLKKKRGEEIGAIIDIIRFKISITTEILLDKVEELNKNHDVHGILIQRPLPAHVSVEKLEMITNPNKDIDGFHPDSPYTLPLPLAAMKIIEEIFELKFEERNQKSETNSIDKNTKTQNILDFNIRYSDFSSWLKNQKIVVLGKGPTGGGPIIKLLNKMGVNAQIIDSKTTNPNELMKKADIIISSVGRENVVNPENIKKGAILIGVGILRGNDGKLKGDYDPEKIKDIAGYYTPTPGGVGPVNVAMLMENLITAAEKQSD